MSTHFLYAVICAQHVYIDSTTVSKPRRPFLCHYNGERRVTATAIAALKATGVSPSFFLLETIDLPKATDVSARRIAWSALFTDSKFMLLSDADRRRVEHPTPAEVAHYDAICHHDLRVLCAPEQDLAPGILTARTGPRELRTIKTTRVDIPTELHQQLLQRASRAGLRISAYLLMCAQENPPAQVDLRAVLECTDTIRQVLALLRSISLDAQRTRTYDQVALVQILAATTEISASLQHVNEQLRTLCRELRKNRSSGTGG